MLTRFKLKDFPAFDIGFSLGTNDFNYYSFNSWIVVVANNNPIQKHFDIRQLAI